MIKFNEVSVESFKNGKKIYLFSASWCKDCILLESYIEEVVVENSDWDFIYVDTDLEENQEFTQENDVLGIPSFVAYIDGEKASSLISKDAKPKSLINSWIKTIGIING